MGTLNCTWIQKQWVCFKSKFFCFLNNKSIHFKIDLESTGKNFAELKEASYALFTLISEMAKVDLDLNSIKYISFGKYVKK
jgi:hypothetical protein